MPLGRPHSFVNELRFTGLAYIINCPLSLDPKSVAAKIQACFQMSVKPTVIPSTPLEPVRSLESSRTRFKGRNNPLEGWHLKYSTPL